jgi:hypothetical protein
MYYEKHDGDIIIEYWRCSDCLEIKEKLIKND